MKGKYHITVANEMVKYDFDIRRVSVGREGPFRVG